MPKTVYAFAVYILGSDYHAAVGQAQMHGRKEVIKAVNAVVGSETAASTFAEVIPVQFPSRTISYISSTVYELLFTRL